MNIKSLNILYFSFINTHTSTEKRANQIIIFFAFSVRYVCVSECENEKTWEGDTIRKREKREKKQKPKDIGRTYVGYGRTLIRDLTFGSYFIISWPKEIKWKRLWK